jgi:hypothetical protein
VTLAFCCQQIVQPGGRLLVYLHSLEKRSRIKKVLVGIVNDPQHAVAVRRGEHFIEPPERQIIRRELAKSLRGTGKPQTSWPFLYLQLHLADKTEFH